MDEVAAQLWGPKRGQQNATSSHRRRISPSYLVRGRGKTRRRRARQELRRMGTEGGLLAAEAAGCDLERSAGRPTGPEVHQPGNSARENLAVSSPARVSRAAGKERAE